MKNTLIKILVIIVLICILGVIVYFALKEDKVSTSNTVSTAEQTNNKERTHNGNSSAEYTGATEITEDSNFDEDTFHLCPKNLHFADRGHIEAFLGYQMQPLVHRGITTVSRLLGVAI